MILEMHHAVERNGSTFGTGKRTALTQWNMLNTLTIAIPAPPNLERWVADLGIALRS